MLKSYITLVFLFLQISLFSQVPTDNLVLHLPFNGNANDESGNGNNGTVNGATLTEDRFGNPNSAYNFDGIDDYIQLPNIIPLTKGSYSFWFKTNSVTSTPQILLYNSNLDGDGFGENVSGAMEYHTGINADKNVFYIFDNDVSADAKYWTETSVNNDSWYHLVLTYDRQNVSSLYINGEFINEQDLTVVEGTNTPTMAYIGRPGFSTRYFNGVFDDLVIYDKVLTQEEITSFYNEGLEVPSYIPTDGLVGYWPFKGNALDESGNGNNGTVNGATLTEDRFGNENSAYSFNGTSNFIEVPDSNSLKTLTEITISTWVNINSWYQSSGQDYFPILHKSNLQSQHGKYALTLKSGGGISHLGEQENGFNYSTWNLNNWYHIVTVFANNINKVYINGNLISEESSGVFPNSYNNDLPLLIGMDSPGLVEYSNGNIDDIGIWNRALTEDEITSIYNEGVEEPLTYVPDDNFEQALIDNGYDDVLDDYVVTSNISGVISLDVREKSISDLTGIEDFIALEVLYCNSNQITSIDVTHNTALWFFNCGDNQLKSLDVTQNIVLSQFYCHSNQLTSLDITHNTALYILQCFSNQITDIDVTQNTALGTLGISRNQLTSIDITQNPALTNLSLDSNSLTSLDVTHNTALWLFYCSANQLTTLDVSKNINMSILYCLNNQLTTLDVSQNTKLTKLYFHNNQITNIDISQNTELTNLYFNNNQITNIDVSQNTELIELACPNNQLTSLDVSQNTSLEELSCEDNLLTALDVKNGNNSLITDFTATNNPSLQCIQVDNESNANSGAAPYNSWKKDDTATYSEDCSAYLGVDDKILSEGLILYPNPVTNTLTLDSKLQLEKVEIYSILGQKVKEVNSDFNLISTDHLSNGIYLIRIYSEKGIIVRKLIKQ